MASANEEKIKHLEFIQAVITRMSSNSFLIEGWSVTLVSAIFALAAKDANSKFAVVAYFPTVLFWGLDALYLSKERQYRELFRETANSDKSSSAFDMDASRFKGGKRSWLRCLVSISIWPFYLFFAALVMLVIVAVLPTVGRDA